MGTFHAGAVLLCIGLVGLSGCATQVGPLATLPFTSSSASSYNLEGIKYYNSGRWEEAQSQFLHAVEVEPQMAEAHFNRALALHQLGRHEEAKEEFQKAGQLAPDTKQIVQSSVYRNHLGLSSTFERHISGGYRY